ncbi:MAG: lipid-A-disaccharide synthase [Bacteroidetes bacterium]|nr:lipid-A-disaccharide synthase [Bacteroidota bacterium]
MKYYLIAGEASGDLHASNLMRELKKRDAEADFRCWGGDLMEAQGATLVKHYHELAFMGFLEVLMNIRTILRNMKFCHRDILSYKPDVLILVDYPGFNLRIARYAFEQGIRVFYYISPQVWAWKKSRVFKIKKYVERMYVILPFEEEFYNKYDYEVDFVGHPLLDAISTKDNEQTSSFRENAGLDERPIVAVLPGSRKQEIRKMLPVMLQMSELFPDHQFVIAAAPSLPEHIYANAIGSKNVKVVYGMMHDLLRNATAAMVTSGTATLETALFGVPEVVCYKGAYISYLIARRLIDIKYISLVNLIMDREVVKELIQADFNQKNLKEELSRILSDEAFRSKMLNDLDELSKKLGGAGASETVARLMYQRLLNNE